LSIRENTTTGSPLLPLSEKCQREDSSSTPWEQYGNQQMGAKCGWKIIEPLALKTPKKKKHFL